MEFPKVGLFSNIPNNMHSRFIQKILLLMFVIISGLSFLIWYSASSGQITRSMANNLESAKFGVTELTFDWNLKENWEGNFKNIMHKYKLPVKNFTSTLSKCSKPFKPTLLENVGIVEKYHFKIIQKYTSELSLDEKEIRNLLMANQKDNISTSFPVLVTAASFEHFKESQGLIRSYHNKLLPLHKNIKLIFYDIGLTKPQRDLMVKYCRCEVRMFPKEEFPEHVSNIRTYTWKPIVIQLLLMEYETVMWADSSIRFLGTSLDNDFLQSREKGIRVMIGSSALINIQTKKESFDYLREDPCLYDMPEIQTGLLVVNRNNFIMTSVMKPWVSCALSFGCMTFDGSFFALMCLGRPRMHQCHRFDQSILSIILTRLFNKNRTIVENSFKDVAVVERNEEVDYFNLLAKRQ